jgi:hydrogenase maturation protein HypF
MTVVAPAGHARLRVTMSGAVQGVGFRPFVHRLAHELGLTGWVLNSNAGLVVEVEGPGDGLDRFLERIDRDRPAAAVVLEQTHCRLEPAGFARFEIRSSAHERETTAGIQADLATCPQCLAELLDPANRRFGYPFTNCTLCGPRYTIVREIPYDRPGTTMRDFRMCPVCRREYAEPGDRRFHAQPIACPACGPRLTGATIGEAAEALRSGLIVALKGIGGFQLLVDARRPEAVARLRRRKHREEKPLAIMAPSLEKAREICHVSAEEQALLESAAAPIVLLLPNGRGSVAANVAADSPFMGVMLPYSPLHHLLMGECGFPVVATSGNQSDEPIAIEDEEAYRRLDGVADLYVLHDRPIARPCDDSVVRVLRGRPSVLRRARGYAPLPVPVSRILTPILAVGGHLKNTVAIGVGKQVFLSQHVGDLDTAEARGAFESAITDLRALYRFDPKLVVCDLHPDYASTIWARASGFPVVAVQHHQAHVAACAAENGVEGPYLGIAWDGAGYGTDGSIWGGEFFRVSGAEFERVAHLRPFRLPGGEAAVREGWRSACSLVWETLGPERIPAYFPPHASQRDLLFRMIEHRVNAPLTTSIGRLFDAVASLAGLAECSRFEGQAAMRLERAIGALSGAQAYPLPHGDWAPLIAAVVEDVSHCVERSQIALKFHNALIEWICSVAQQLGEGQIVLSGGVFQNGYLVERSAARLENLGFSVFTHHQVPCNDGGIALGQAVLAGCAW